MDLNERINKIGISFFIDYTYYLLIDKNEQNWQKASSKEIRLNHYKKLSYKDLKEIVKMPLSTRVDKNKMDISYEYLIEMKEKLKSILDNYSVLNISIHIVPNNYLIRELIDYLKIINKAVEEVFDDYGLINADANTFIRNICEGSWILNVLIFIGQCAGNYLIDKLFDSLIDKIKRKNKKINYDDIKIKHENGDGK